MSRKKRSLNLKFKVFCEGDTEYNYFEYIRKNKIISLTLNAVNMSGGGYANFMTELKKDSNTDCLAKFIIIDGDRANAFPKEAKALKELVQYCIIQNKSERTPHILIIDYPDFEYVGCLHCEEYKGGSVEKFIKDSLKYKSVEDFKADEYVYDKLNSGKNTHENVKTKVSTSNNIIVNRFNINKSQFEILVDTIYEEANIGKRGTNFQDFFDVTGSW